MATWPARCQAIFRILASTQFWHVDTFPSCSWNENLQNLNWPGQGGRSLKCLETGAICWHVPSAPPCHQQKRDSAATWVFRLASSVAAVFNHSKVSDRMFLICWSTFHALLHDTPSLRTTPLLALLVQGMIQVSRLLMQASYTSQQYHITCESETKVGGVCIFTRAPLGAWGDCSLTSMYNWIRVTVHRVILHVH